jgi:hypothetical protein
MREIYLIAEKQLSSQEELCYLKLTDLLNKYLVPELGFCFMVLLICPLDRKDPLVYVVMPVTVYQSTRYHVS